MTKVILYTIFVFLYTPFSLFSQNLEHFEISFFTDGFKRTISESNVFGSSLASIGDLDGDGIAELAVGAIGDDDGIAELAVGAIGDDDGAFDAGAIWILFLNPEGKVKQYQKISAAEGGFEGELDDFDGFGSSLASIGDLDGDGIAELAVGAIGDDDGVADEGAIWILFLNPEGKVKQYQKISAAEGGLEGELDNFDGFGSSLASIGDLDGDGIAELVVGAIGDDDNGSEAGAVWILFLDEVGFVKAYQKISLLEDEIAGSFVTGDNFGSSLASIGDLDGDGIAELAVGAIGDDDNGSEAGAVWILFLDEVGFVKAYQKISLLEDEFAGSFVTGDNFGSSLASIGDLDGDGIAELAVGAIGDDDGAFDAGAIWILFLNPEGKVKQYQKISAAEGGFEGELDTFDRFGSSLASIGDLDGDGIAELAVGAIGDDDGVEDAGAVWIFEIEGLSTINGIKKISLLEGGFRGTLLTGDRFGSSLASIGDLDGDGIAELAVGATGDDTVGEDAGSVWILFLNREEKVKKYLKISAAEGGFEGELDDFDGFGSSLASIGDLDGDGIAELAVGAIGDDDNGSEAGAVWILFLDEVGFVKAYQKISLLEDEFAGSFVTGDNFGSSLASIGDLDGDGIAELAVGAIGDDDGAFDAGAIWILFLNPEGKVKQYQKISAAEGGFEGELDTFDRFGSSLASIGDLDGDGIAELAVGAIGDDDAALAAGAVWILFLDKIGKINKEAKVIATDRGGLDRSDSFGSAITTIGDLNGDGISEIAVGARGDDDGATNSGALWIVFLTEQGMVWRSDKISAVEIGYQINEDEFFGSSISVIPDFDEDSISELIVGSTDRHNLGATTLLYVDGPPVFIDSNTSSVSVNSNNEIAINTFVKDKGNISVNLNFKRGGDPPLEYFSKQLVDIGSNQFAISIPSTFYTDQGWEIFLEATDDFGYKSRYPSKGVIDIRMPIEESRMNNPFPRNKYKLISVPYELLEARPEQVLEDDLGTYDQTIWRFFEPIHGIESVDFPEYPKTSNFTPGHAFWLIADRQNNFIDMGEGFSTPTSVPFSIAIESGWNYIGLPYTFSIPVNQLYLKSGDAFTLFTYNGVEWDSLSSSELLEPFEGYVIPSMQDRDTLYFSSIPLAKKGSDKSDEISKESDLESKVVIHALVDDLTAQATIRILDESSHDLDHFDKPAPPLPMGDYVTVSFPHDGWVTPFSHYAVDTRPPGEAGYVWDVEVSTNAGDLIELNFEDINSVPQSYEVWLVDKASSITQNLRLNASYIIGGPRIAEPKQLQLFVGKVDYVEEQGIIERSLPTTFSLSQNYPNPFKTTTTIPFSLPKAERVRMTVYNLLGAHVATIIASEDIPAGYHAALWDGRSDIGVPVASGIYFIRMEAGDFFDLKNAVLVR